MKKAFLSFCGIVCALSCSEISPTLSDVDQVVTFNDVSFLTKATESSFENGDPISVFATDDRYGDFGYDNYADNVKYVYSAGKFTPATYNDGITYPDDYTDLSFCAIYPYSTDYSESEIDFSVKLDQRASADYHDSNLMVAVTSATDSKSVDLAFDHMMCKVIVNYSGSNIPAGDTYMMLNDVYYTASIDLNEMKVETGTKVSPIIGCPNGTNSFKVLIPPQVIVSGTEFMYIVIGDKSWVWRPSKNLHLSSGTEYEYSLTLN